MNVTVLRLGHRYSRDARISTHLALTARAFGADRVVYDVVDSKLKECVDGVTAVWGGSFKVEFADGWREYIRSFRGVRVHLTMYGLPLDDVVPNLVGGESLLAVVGGAKVPSEVYSLVDYNVAVGGQPHSEVAALAVFLDRLFGVGGLAKEFKGKKKVIPQECGKKVVESL